jgi:predicted transposase/invertase (TIGR01784 family)
MATRSIISFDWAIKNRLRDKANFEILEGFLSELLKRKIKIKYIAESESNKTQKDDKYNRVDIFVEAGSKELVIIELQFDSENDYFQRMLYGTSKAVIEHIKKGDKYEKIRKAYSINIVYFDLGAGDDYIYHGTTTFKGMHTNNELQLDDKQKKLYNGTFVADLYPEYYIIKTKKFDDTTKTTLDEWIYYFKNDKIKDEFTAQGLDKAREILIYDNMSDKEKDAYWYNIEARRIKNSVISTAFLDGEIKGRSEGKAEGEKIGIEKGIKKGKAEGLIEGEAKGIAKGKLEEKLEIAKNLKNMGIPLEQIMKATSLTTEEIEKI